MDAREFLDTYGFEEARRVAESAGTNFAYFWQLANGYRFPSRDLAVKLEKASDGRMSRVALIWPGWRHRTGEYSDE